MTPLRVLGLAGALAAIAWPFAQAQDVRAIQAREARRTDERTLAYFEKFRAALTAKAGADPLLSMLVFDEQEAQALVHASRDAGAEHVIYRQGAWIGTDGRQLRPWAPEAGAAVARFPLSAVQPSFVRERMNAHRADPQKATDFLGPVRVGYFGAPVNKLLLEIQVGSMSALGLSAVQFDLATGLKVDVAAALRKSN
ncbi:MAG: hypothetical protein OEV46_03180 [Betaproteobacteria bacterium]|jgi:hypothetical protein|nr:hypothetical protein [Betaproteobacteria bacterium]MDH5286226.1 hypothetical protein [Betaproteobacteria bacterium]